MEGGNNYVITVKGNQPTLFRQIKSLTADRQNALRFIDVEKIRNRITCRIVSVFDDISDINPDWSTVKRLVQVERIGIRQQQPYQQTNYYISSLAASAAQFAQIICGYWRVDNCLHWVKDVVFKEDIAIVKS